MIPWQKPPAPLRIQLTFMHNAIGLRDRELAFVAGVSASTARRWRLSGEGERPMAIDDLTSIVRALRDGEAFSPKLIGGWLRSRNRGLGHGSPARCVAKRQFRRRLSHHASGGLGGFPARQRCAASEQQWRGTGNETGLSNRSTPLLRSALKTGLFLPEVNGRRRARTADPLPEKKGNSKLAIA